MENLLSDKHDWKVVISVLGETRIVEDLILSKESLVFCKQISVANTTNGKAYVNCFKKSFASDLGQVRERINIYLIYLSTFITSIGG
jgi:hypothetical protein